MPTLDKVNQELLFCMLKGEPGTRKSTQALSFPAPQYWFSVDQKMNALTLPAKAWGIDTSTIDYDDYADWDSIRKKLEWMQSQSKGRLPFKTIIIDSVTSAGDATGRQTLGAKTEENRVNKVGGIPVDSLESYKAEASAFREMIGLLKDIHHYHGIHVVLIAHVVGERKADESKGATVHSRIIITGGKTISAKLVAYCSEVYHFDVKPNTNPDKEGKYGLLTVHTGDDFARTSLPLKNRIEFGNESLYTNYLLPAINKLKLTNQEK